MKSLPHPPISRDEAGPTGNTPPCWSLRVAGQRDRMVYHGGMRVAGQRDRMVYHGGMRVAGQRDRMVYHGGMRDHPHALLLPPRGPVEGVKGVSPAVWAVHPSVAADPGHDEVGPASHLHGATHSVRARRTHAKNDLLFRAARDGRVDEAKRALADGADFSARATIGKDVLAEAATYGQAKIVNLLLATGADVHSDDDAALYCAAFGGYAEVVRILIAAGADVHAGKNRALCWAASCGHAEVVRILLTAGADPLSAWPIIREHWTHQAAVTLDACADAMTPAQRTALAECSPLLTGISATVRAASRHQHLQRWRPGRPRPRVRWIAAKMATPASNGRRSP